MNPVGGFFDLELSASGGSYHSGALTLSSGRSCLRRILEIVRPRRVYVPFYICDSALIPFDVLGTPYVFYSLTGALEPQLPSSIAHDECLLYVNYFGLKTECATQLAIAMNGRVIVDDTQAFYQRGYSGAWSFNSARKFFGVPDGAYAYGPGLDQGPVPARRSQNVRYDHLVNRLLGRQRLAYRQYVQSEQRISAEVRGPSILAERLLAGVDYDRTRESRRWNFALVHERLGPHNRLLMELSQIGEAVPFCYPFLPAVEIEHDSLWRRQIFVPRLWPEVEHRVAEGFAWEREFAAWLLPLPIDHRYGEKEMNRVCTSVLKELDRLKL